MPAAAAEFAGEARAVAPARTAMGQTALPALAEQITKDAKTAAQELTLRLRLAQASTTHEIDAVFAQLDQLRPGGLVIDPNFLSRNRSAQLGALAMPYPPFITIAVLQMVAVS